MKKFLILISILSIFIPLFTLAETLEENNNNQTTTPDNNGTVVEIGTGCSSGYS